MAVKVLTKYRSYIWSENQLLHLLICLKCYSLLPGVLTYWNGPNYWSKPEYYWKGPIFCLIIY